MPAHSKQFAYIVQCRKHWDYLHTLQSDNSDLYLLNFKQPLRYVKGVTSIYYPKSSWNEGRNRLYEIAKKKGYEYYIFLDDDVQLDYLPDANINPFRYLEACLNYYKPASLVGNYDWHFKNLQQWQDELQTIRMYDACLHAMHHSVTKKVLPYPTQWDNTSWWKSQYIICQRIAHYFPYSAVALNHLNVANALHDEYPKCANDYSEPYEVLKIELNNSKRLKTWKDSLYINDGDFVPITSF
jgi:hypothetical protein